MGQVTITAPDTAITRFCPKCLSAHIEHQISSIEVIQTREGWSSVPAKCLQCAWTGLYAELLTHKVEHQSGKSEVDILRALATDMQSTMAKHWALELGRFLMRWGFVPSDVTPQQLGRYLSAAATATLQAIMRERVKIESEANDGTA
jgi:hypothetical protein